MPRSDWSIFDFTIPFIISEKPKVIINKILDNRTSSWNTLGIPKDTSGVNFIGLNEQESNS